MTASITQNAENSRQTEQMATKGTRDARRVYGQLTSVVDRFLPVEVRLLGALPYDDRVVRAVALQMTEDLLEAWGESGYRAAKARVVAAFDAGASPEDFDALQTPLERATTHVATLTATTSTASR